MDPGIAGNVFKIFGIRFLDFENERDGEIEIIHGSDNTGIQNYTCGIWREPNWEFQSNPEQIENGLFRCRYRKSGYFALSSELNITRLLENILNSDDSIEALLRRMEDALSKFYDQLDSSDVVFIPKALMRVNEINDNILELCVNILNVTLNIERGVLRDSQNSYGATQEILYFFAEIAGMWEFPNSNGTFRKILPNLGLAIFPLDRDGARGLGIADHNGGYNLTFLEGHDLDMISLNRVNSWITLDRQLVEELLCNTTMPVKVIVTMFFNNAFFNEDQQEANNIGTIFGVKITSLDNTFNYGILYSKVLQHSGENGICLYWHTGENGESSWTIVGKVTDSSCRFFRQGYFAIVENDELNITRVLQDILDSNEPTLEKLRKTEGVTHFFNLFQPIDVRLLSDISKSITDLDEETLEIIRRIGENFFAIPRSVRVDSQIQHNALKVILKNINKIGSYVLSSKPVTLDNKISLVVCSVPESVGVVLDGNLRCLLAQESDVEVYTAKMVLNQELFPKLWKTEKGRLIVHSSRPF
ncbi:hypothetical protein JTB14_008926 [Gonioctena quinquepunctata]|nr:hypothetical protein JTB14_008926 [Gonioctena quinquepunctata]